MPPQHGKSEIISKWFPTWRLGKNPAQRIMHTSYGDRYSQKWGRQARAALAACGVLFGVSVSTEKAEMREWEVAQYGGSMFSAGAGGEFTGRSADLLIVDDPVKNAEEAVSETAQENLWDWFQTTALTRLAANGDIVVVATRWHNRDLTGRLIEKWTDEDEPFHVCNLPAIAEHDDPLGRKEGEPLCPELKPLSFLESQKRTLSAYWWNALYQGRPTQHDRAEFPGEYFEDHIWVDAMPDNLAATVVALDPSKGKNAKRGDFSAAVLVGVYHGRAYVDAVIERCPVGRAVANTLGLAFRYGAKVVAYESNNFQELIGGEFESQLRGHRLHGLNIVPVENMANKEGRIASLDRFFKNGEVRFVRSPGTKLLVDQLREFPMAAHDDGPDALEVAIRQSLGLMRSGNAVDPVQEILRQRGFV